MRNILNLKNAAAVTAAFMALSAAPAQAAVDAETAYVLNTFSFLVNGALVMWMAAGFAMLESGLVRSKNTATICLKNIALYSLAGLTFYLVGYNLMYLDVTGYVGSLSPFWGPDDAAALEGTFEEGGYSASSDWFFQMVFVATAASIVSGALAERVKLWSFLAFVVLLTAIIYPIQGSWVWGGGWLSEMGFSDYAGSTLVHSVGGWAALSGAIILGARKGKYAADGRVQPIPGANLPLATLGTFVLWLGWFGFNGGSVLALGSAASAIEMSNVFANTNMAAAGGVIAAMVMTQVLYKKVDLTMALNGAIAGLVSITAEPADPSMGMAVLIGAVGGVIVVLAVPFLDKLKIDDVVGAIPAHLFAGIWGTLAVAFSDPEATIITQLIGIVAIGAFALVLSTVFWFILKFTIGLRVDEEDEVMGLDKTELGLEAYPEFGRGSQTL
ncbi:ammonium transporter [Sneathiella marina]|uniref:Ammonium transporter n=1 Tax=Sneathiella marina TaxID=2950108 RepID=A0ABY4W6L8_9PROT|nr:ammonium transporter [Sneathiella marina]USG61562.1 ammonium transporter [Sneathiella marina]